MNRWRRLPVRCFIAALWALPGPILVGLFLAVTLGPYEYSPDDIRDIVETAVRNVAARPDWFVVQIPLAVCYGFTRALVGPTDLKRGIAYGAAFWVTVGLIAGCMTYNWFFMDRAVKLGRIEPDDWSMVRAVARYFGHILSGAIAGFHVEHYLLREAKRNREVTNR